MTDGGLIPLLPLLLLATVLTSQTSGRDLVISVFLPALRHRVPGMSLEAARPAVDVALETARSMGLLAGLTVRVVANDSQCDYKVAPVVGLLLLREVDVMLGPFCSFSLAAVARYNSYHLYQKPIISSGGAASALDNKAEYFNLARVGAISQNLEHMLLSIFRHYKWPPRSVQNLLLVHVPDEVPQLAFNAQELMAAQGRLMCNAIEKQFSHQNNYIVRKLPYAPNNTHFHREVFRVLRDEVRLVVLCADPDTVREIMIKAYEHGFINGEYVFFNIDLFSSEQLTIQPWYRSGDTASNNQAAAVAYRTLLTVTLRRLHRGRGHRCQGYSLVQSPQQLKQLLMVAGFDRYFQLARCYRDESGRPDRQPEFTQLDLEMSFADDTDIQALVESALLDAWPSDDASLTPPMLPFPRITYAEAMARYGTDKPDTRFGLTAQRWTLSSGEPIVGFCALPAETAAVSTETVRAALSGAPLSTGWRVDGGREFRRLLGAGGGHVGDNDIVLYGPASEVGSLVATTRSALHAALVSIGALPQLDWRQLHLLWVERFPLFESAGLPNGHLSSCHHPFTAPVPEHLDGLLSGQLSPTEIIGRHFDLVCNGCELGGGSVRIHDPKLQLLVLEKVLGLDPEPMRHLIEALGHGAPPHAGIALGVDRLVALLTGADCIADCMAFPKTQEGRCLLSGSPAVIDADTLAYYRLRPAGEN